jgi:4-hydroxy-2-oxoheptanedioate aldolase
LLATDGIDGCWIGPADLALSMGLAPEQAANDDEHRRAIEKVLRACVNTGKVPGFASGSAHEALMRAREGFRFLTVGNEIGFIRQGCEDTVAALQSGVNVGSSGPRHRYE